MRLNKLQQVACDFVDRRTHASRDKNTSGALHNRGDYAYSYNEPIAKHTGQRGPLGKPLILMTSRSFSATTSKHQSAIRRAVLNAGYEIMYEDRL